MNFPIRLTTSTLAAIGLSSLLSCGGGGGGSSTPPQPNKTIADTLVYTDPSTGNYKLVRDSSSTSSKLVMNVTGPSGVTGHGLALILNISGTTASWATVSGSAYVQNGPFNLGSGPQIQVGKMGANGQLQIALFQKQNSASAVSLNQNLAKISLALGNNVPVNTPITVSLSKGNVLLADGSLVDLTGSGQFGIGNLTAN
jgi:hypothetical protein